MDLREMSTPALAYLGDCVLELCVREYLVESGFSTSRNLNAQALNFVRASAQAEAMKYIRAGVSGRDADKVARDVITDAGYGAYFGHSLGHSLGLEIHELPSVSPKSEAILVSGNIVTVEPGIYIPGKYGVRIENMVLVTDDGCINLTNSERQLIEL